MKPSFCRGAIEPLEARIAPAAILFQTGLINPPAKGTPGEIDYTDADGGAEDAFFVNTEADPNDPISAIVGIGAPGVADTFYAKLTPNSALTVFNNTGFRPLISGDGANSGISGTIIAFFVDKNLDNEVQLNELTGLALGNKVKAIVSGSVDGDVLTNFNDATGRLGGSSEVPGTATSLLNNTLSNVTISGNVNGSVMSGGKMSNVKVTGTVRQVAAGTAANNYTFDFNTAAIADGGDTLTVATPAAGVKGVPIIGATVGDLAIPDPADPLNFLPGKMIAGNGGPGAAGGALSKITVLADTTGFTLQAGSGGAGAAGRASGGAGGAISSVVVNGLHAGESDVSPNSLILIKSGDGGDASAGSKGGKGGVAQNIFVGFESVLGNGIPQRSVTPFFDQVTVQGGTGGAGAIGGAGGFAKSISIFSAPTGSQNDIEVLGGTGGGTTGAKAGKGGAVADVFALNPSTDVDAHTSKIALHGGNGGAASATAKGAPGGSVSSINLIGYQHELRGGEGSAGLTGGSGGALSKIVLRDGAESVRAENISLNGGVAGVGLNGKGGNGGAVTGVTVLNGDLISLNINSTVLAGDGATSKKGPGGKGGAVKQVSINELDTGNAGIANIRGGNGGAGGDATPAGGKGGSGGGITNTTISGVQLDVTLTGGKGGDATLKGAGGVGGGLSSIFSFTYKQLDRPDDPPEPEVSATLTGGTGGKGAGGSNGGRGGDAQNNSVTVGRGGEFFQGDVKKSRVDGGPVTVAGGGGGDSAGGRGGGGGSVLASYVATFGGDVSVIAANAGAGVKRSAGGRVTAVAIDVGQKVTLISGAGSGGGAGGDITNCGYSRAVEDADLVGTLEAPAASAPLGAVTITAGDGSGAGKAVGAGGSIKDLSGYVGISGMTTIKAGQGGAVATKAASGGSITDASLFGGGGPDAELRIQAGDAANSASARIGGTGGSIRTLGIGVTAFVPSDPLLGANLANSFAIDPETIILSIAAGNGGSTGLGTGRGGAGGSVVEVDVHHDIGVRSGRAFGFDTMGGIFAGAGGLNTSATHSPTTLDARDGQAGSVLGVTADAIAAIVAGRPNVGSIITVQNMASKVDNVILYGLTNPTIVDENGTYTNFDSANLVGGVVDPTATGVPYFPPPPAPGPVMHPHANTFDETGDPLTTEFIDNDNNDEFSVGDTTTVNTDGFVAAISFINNLANIRPEAVLTFVNGAPKFIDLNNTNGQEPPLQP